jgi:hypothetical protein
MSRKEGRRSRKEGMKVKEGLGRKEGRNFKKEGMKVNEGRGRGPRKASKLMISLSGGKRQAAFSLSRISQTSTKKTVK